MMDVPDGVTRRRVLATTSAVVASGGGVVAFAGTQRASAQVSAEGINIPDSEYESKDGQPPDVRLIVTGNYNFRVENADEFTLELFVAHDGQDYQRLDRSEQPAMSNQMGSEYSLEGSILDHDDWSLDDFSAEPEETVRQNVPVKVVLTVLNGGETVVSGVAETDAVIDVTNSSIAASATVGGDGQVTFAA